MYGQITYPKAGYKPLKFTRIPSRPLKYSSFYNLQGGINTFQPSHQIKNNQLADCYNMEYSTWGLKTRLGKAKYSTELSGATSVRGLHSSYSTGSRFILAADDQGKIYKDNGTGTFSPIHTDTTADSSWWFEDWLTYVFWCNGTDELWRYDGSTVEEMTNAPSGLAGVINAENRLFGWKLTENNLYFTDIRDGNNWDTTTEYSGFLVVPQVKGDFIVSCIKQGKYVIVFKNNSIWRYYVEGLPRNWSRELISDSLGIAGRFARDAIENVIFFMGSDGRVYQLTDSIKLISNNIDSPSTSRWGLPTDLDFTDKNETIVKYLPSKRVVRVIYNDVSSTADYPNKYADYYLTREAWLRGSLAANCMTINSGKDDNGYMYVGDPATGFIYRIDTTNNDNTTAIENYLITKDWDLGIVDLRKIFETAYVSCYPSGNWNATFTEFIDFDATGTSQNFTQTAGGAVWDTGVWDTDVWGGAGLVRSRLDLGNNAGYYWHCKIGINTTSKYIEIRGIGLAYKLEALV